MPYPLIFAFSDSQYKKNINKMKIKIKLKDIDKLKGGQNAKSL